MSFNLVQSRSGSLLSSAQLGRRHLLQVGGLGLMGLSLPKNFRAGDFFFNYLHNNRRTFDLLGQCRAEI